MNKTMLISEMLKFHFGNKIFCSDGDGGVLAQVLFDPATHSMAYIGVKQGRLFGKNVHLPFDSLLSATGEGITLRVKRSDLDTATSQVPGYATLTSKSVVENTKSAAKGSLLLVAVHPTTGELAYIVAHDLRSGQDTLLQETYITKLETGRIIVSIDEGGLRALPSYRPDRVLQQEVEAALFDFTPLHIDLKAITARVIDSVLYLDGNISSTLRSDVMLDRVSGVEGLAEIKNRVIADDTLAADLALALGQDAQTRDLPIGVYPRLGVVRLSGAVHNGQQKTAAGKIAKNFPGVRSVTNDLVVDPNATLLNVMSAPEGGESKDVIPGKYVRHTQ
ncbi:MAG TPA: BON domain-containing protein [Ktedonobacteraceae bacterium]|nr:BON domain-containing protein [Ktedonobacteraceae bacterium]